MLKIAKDFYIASIKKNSWLKKNDSVFNIEIECEYTFRYKNYEVDIIGFNFKYLFILS